MSASISLLRSRRKIVDNCDDSGEESDCSIKDPKKKESIEKDARAIAAINMLTVSMVNQLLEQQGLDPFGKSLGSPSLDDDQTWSTPVRATSRQSITRSIKENTLTKKSRKSVRFTPDTSKAEFPPERSCDSERLDLTHTRTVSMSALKMEPKFTPLRRSKALKAGLLRSLENEQDIISVDNFACSNDSFDSPLPVRNLALNSNPQEEAMDDAPVSSMAEVKPEQSIPEASQEQPVSTTPVPKSVPNEPASLVLPNEETACEGDKEANVSTKTELENPSDQNDIISETPIKPRWTHHFDPTSPEHMSPFLKTLLEERAERGQGKELSKSFSMLEDSEDQPRLSVLKGVVAFVEVRKADEDRSSGFRWKLKQLGAQVEENFTKKVTHVVFQEGLLSTYRKAKESNVHLVSAVWVMACDESSTRAPEDKYPIDEEDKYSMLAPLKKYIRRPKLMSPNLGDDNDEKRLARRLQAIKRRSMKIEGSSGSETDPNDGVVAHSSKTNPDGKTQQSSKRASLGKKPAAPSVGSTFMNAWLARKKKPDAEKESEPDVLSVDPELRSSAISDKSSRKRPADVQLSDSPAKQMASCKSAKSPVKAEPVAKSFDSPVKTKSSSRFIDSPVKTKSSSRFVDSLLKTKSSSRFVDSPVKTKSSSRFVDSPVKPKSSSRSGDSPAKSKSSSRSGDSTAKSKPSSRLGDSPAKSKSSSRSGDSPAKSKSSSRSSDSPAKSKSSSRSGDSTAKSKPSSRLGNSPAKSKSSSRSGDSPAKTKSSSRSGDSPAKTNSSSRSADSPAKTQNRSRFVDSPVKVKSSLRFVDSPVKTKSSSRVVDSPVKTKSSSRVVDSSVKSKSSSRSADSPVKPKSTTRSYDSPVKIRSSARVFDSPAKANPSIHTVDSPKKTKLSSKEIDSTSSTSAPLKTSSKTRTPSKYNYIKESHTTPVKNLPPKATCTVTSGGALASTAVLCSSSANVETEGRRTPRKSAMSKPVGNGSITGWLAANSAALTSPAKRSLSGALKGITSKPARRSEASKSSKTKEESKSGPILETLAEAEFTSPELFEAPKKKARMSADPLKKASAEGKTQSSFGAAKQLKTTSRGPNQSRNIKKISPRGRAASKNKNNDKNQTVLTSHFRLVVSPKEDTKSKVVSEEPCRDVSENESVLISSTEEDHSMETSPPRVESHIGVKCPPVVGTSDDIDCEMPLASPPIVESENQKSVVDAREELHSYHESVDPQISAVVTEQPQTTAGDCEEPALTAGLREEQNSSDADKVCEQRSSVRGEPTPAIEEQRTTEEQSSAKVKTAAEMSDETATEERSLPEGESNQQLASADSREERITTSALIDQQPLSADSSEERSAVPLVSDEQPIAVDSPEERSASLLVSDEKPISADSPEERSTTTLVSDEHPISADSPEGRSTTSLVSDEQPIPADSPEEKSAAPLVIDEKPISADSSEERSTSPLVIDEKPIPADSSEERSEAPLVSDDKPISAVSSEERSTTPLVIDEKPISADSSEERSEAPLVSDEKPISADSSEERSTTPLVIDEKPILADSSEERSEAPLVSDEKPISADSSEERSTTPLVIDEKPILVDSSEERSEAPLVSDEKPISADSSEERSKTPLVSDEQPISADSAEERSATPVMNEEQPTWAILSEEGTATLVVSDGRTASANAVEESARSFDAVVEKSAESGIFEDTRTLSDMSVERPIVTNELPDKSSGSLSRDTEGSCDSFTSFSSVNSTEGGKRTRKSIKPVTKQSNYRTRRSTRFTSRDVTD